MTSILFRKLSSLRKRKLITVMPNATILDAVKIMNKHPIGTLLVKRGNDIIGVLTERDILLRVIAKEKNPRSTAVASVMSTKLLCTSGNGTLLVAAHLMHKHKKKKVLLKEGKRIVGIITQTDIIRLLSADAPWKKKRTSS